MKYEVTFKHKNGLPSYEAIRTFGETSIIPLARSCFKMGKSGFYVDLTVKRVYKADEVTKWISCKDELPEPCKVVLVCTDEGIIRTGYYMECAIKNKSHWIVNGFSPMSEYKVIAWQQLPAPYKENS